MKTAIQNPLFYSRARSLIKELKLKMKMAQAYARGCCDREVKEREQRLISESNYRVVSDHLKAAEEANKQLQTKLEAMPRGGVHSPLVLKLVEGIIDKGEEEYLPHDNSSDEMKCPQCGAWSFIRYNNGSQSWNPIKHHDDCMYVMAKQIQASME